MMAKQMSRRKNVSPRRGTHAQTALPPWVGAVVAAFIGGTAVAIVLLAAFAFLSERFSLPVTAVRPMAMAAAWCAAAVSGYILATRLRQQRLLCGLLCGLFYCACLLCASYLCAGSIDLQGPHMALPIALLLGGLVGGIISAMRASPSAPRR